MPGRKHCLIGGLLCFALAAAFGWFILEPFTERVFVPAEDFQQEPTNGPLQASAAGAPQNHTETPKLAP
jgi:hypothetical protein